MTYIVMQNSGKATFGPKLGVHFGSLSVPEPKRDVVEIGEQKVVPGDEFCTRQ